MGKWHLDGGDYFGSGQCPDGWDRGYWYDMHNYLDELTTNERVDSRNQDTIFRGEGYEDSFIFGHRCSNRAIDFIEKHKDKDFFLAPKKYAEHYKNYELPLSHNIHDTLEDKPEHHRIWAGEQLHEDRTALYEKTVLCFRGEYFY